MSNILTVVFREPSEVPESEHSLSFRELWAFYIVCLHFPLPWAALWPIKHPRMPLEDKLQSSHLGAVKMSFKTFKGPLKSELQICFQSLQHQMMMMKLCMVQSLGWIHSSEHFYRGFLGWQGTHIPFFSAIPVGDTPECLPGPQGLYPSLRMAQALESPSGHVWGPGLLTSLGRAD